MPRLPVAQAHANTCALSTCVSAADEDVEKQLLTSSTSLFAVVVVAVVL